jgi:hypothetical protein
LPGHDTQHESISEGIDNMKAQTEIIVGIRNVGDAAAEPKIESTTVIEAAKLIATQLLGLTMARRIQISLGRTRDEVMVGLGLSQTNKEARLKDKASETAAFIDSLFGGDDETVDAPAGESGPDSQQAHQSALDAGHAESITEENHK